MNDQPLWMCPVCRSPLSRSPSLSENRLPENCPPKTPAAGNSASSNPIWRCPQNHSFDIAKAGYINLLLANQKKSKLPGDSQEMLASRKRFFAAGHYLPLATELASTVGSLAQDQDKIIDLGCGEGYYLNAITNQLHGQYYFAGIDIAKKGLQMAAKICPKATWICASNNQLPVLNHAADIILRVFAPSKDSELLRILKSTGHLIMVTPASHHLFELKSLIYDKVKLHEPPPTPKGFELANYSETQWTMALNTNEDLMDLLRMTPFYWTANAAVKRSFEALNQASITGHIGLSIFKPAKNKQ